MYDDLHYWLGDGIKYSDEIAAILSEIVLRAAKENRKKLNECNALKDLYENKIRENITPNA